MSEVVKWASELFSVGDVAIIKSEHFHHGFDIGDEVEIIKIEDDKYRAKSLTTNAEWWVADCELKLSYETVDLYTCENGKLLAEKGQRFGCWDSANLNKFANRNRVYYKFVAKKDALTIASGNGENDNYPIYADAQALPKRFERADREARIISEMEECLDKLKDLHRQLSSVQRRWS